jgi:ribosome-associated toxin RatA of RatAB toxin-antitoxin module
MEWCTVDNLNNNRYFHPQIKYVILYPMILDINDYMKFYSFCNHKFVYCKQQRNVMTIKGDV